MTEAYDGREVVGMDRHRRRSVLVRMTADGKKLETARITNSPAELRRQIARAGKSPRVVLEATYGWYWAADTLAAAGAEVHLAHPLGVKGFAYRATAITEATKATTDDPKTTPDPTAATRDLDSSGGRVPTHTMAMIMLGARPARSRPMTGAQPKPPTMAEAPSTIQNPVMNPGLAPRPCR